MSNWLEIILQMRERGVRFDSGLSNQEIESVQTRYRFRFPPDLRAFIQVAMPKGNGFPDWRADPEAVLRQWLELPLEGILYDIEHNGFWPEEWGTRPPSIDEANRVARDLVSAAPRLIPIYKHRMMPDEPHLPGNPVFSVQQTDIICYGIDLKDYLRTEFNLPVFDPAEPGRMRTIRFWNIEHFQRGRRADESGNTDPHGFAEEIPHEIEYRPPVKKRPSSVKHLLPHLILPVCLLILGAISSGIKDQEKKEARKSIDSIFEELEKEAIPGNRQIPKSVFIGEAVLRHAEQQPDASNKAFTGQNAAILRFIGFHFINSRTRFSYCRRLGVDPKTFSAEFRRAHQAEMAIALANRKIYWIGFESYHSLWPYSWRFVTEEMNDLGKQLGLDQQDTCRFIDQNGARFVRENLLLSRVDPDTYRWIHSTR